MVDEDIETGCIQQIDLRFFPLHEGERCGNCNLAVNLLVVEIGNRIALVNSREAIYSACRVEQPGGERCLTGMSVAHHTDVPYVLAFVYFHWLHLDDGAKPRILSHHSEPQRTSHPQRTSVQSRDRQGAED